MTEAELSPDVKIILHPNSVIEFIDPNERPNGSELWMRLSGTESENLIKFIKQLP